MVCTPTLEHRKLEFPGYSAGDGLGASPGFCNEIGGLWPMAPCGLVCTPTLEHRKLEFPGYSAGDGLGASPGFCNEIGGLWPMAPCGRSSL
jgi:hypothetical protein